jgi:hypothetical protein
MLSVSLVFATILLFSFHFLAEEIEVERGKSLSKVVGEVITRGH